MKRAYVFVITFCLSFALFGIIFQEKKTVDQLLENVKVENIYSETFNNGKKDFLYTFVESNGKKITIISNVDKTKAAIISMR